MTAVQDFLFELGTEELPPLALPELERSLAEGITAGLAAAGLGHGAVKSYAAPRRLAVLVCALPTTQPEQQIKRRGPPVNAAFDKLFSTLKHEVRTDERGEHARLYAK